MAAVGSPPVVVSDDDQSAVLMIVTLFLMIVIIFSVVMRISMKAAIAKAIDIDDWIISAAFLFGLLQSIVVTVATQHGLGKKENLLTNVQITDVKKAMFASDLLYTCAVACTRVSILLLIKKLAAKKPHKLIALYTSYFVVLWSVAAVLVLGLRCGTHAPWGQSLSAGVCLSTSSIWTGLFPFDVLSELVAMILPIFMMIPVQVSISKKLFVVGAFFARVLVIGTLVARLFFLPKDFTAPTFTFDNNIPVMLTQSVLCVAVATACLPSLKAALEAFNSGKMAVHVSHDGHGTYGSGTGSKQRSAQLYVLSSMQKSPAHFKTTQVDEEEDDVKMAEIQRNNTLKTRPSQDHSQNDTALRTASHDSEECGRDSMSSQARSEQMIIKKDIQWTVSYEDPSHRRTHAM